MFVRNLLVATLLTLAAGPVAFAQSNIQLNDLYFDYEVEKRPVYTPQYCVMYEGAYRRPRVECFATALARNNRVMELQIQGVTILRIWAQKSHWGSRPAVWQLHSVEDTLAAARAEAAVVESSGLWETRINTVTPSFEQVLLEQLAIDP
ncbi:MAG: hypothetical protein ACR2NP_04795 [Pirellulaceae bacterium]